MKTNIRELDNGGEDNPIWNVPVHRWEDPDRAPWNDETMVGLLCEEVAKTVPEAIVRPGPDVANPNECGGDLTVVQAYMVAAIQYLKQRIDELEDRR